MAEHAPLTNPAEQSGLRAAPAWRPLPPAWLAWSACAGLIALWGYLRLVAFHEIVLPLTFVLPLLLCVWTRRRQMLWAMAAVFVVMAAAEVFWIKPSHRLPPDEIWPTFNTLLINIFVGALAIHWIIILRDRLERSLENLTEANEHILGQNSELAQQAEELACQTEELTQQSEELAGHNEELNQQSEELAQQNEELAQQSEELAQQNEELQAQSEEIQALNAELGQREALLQSLLDAARLSGSEHTAIEKICAAAQAMFGELKPVIVVYEKQDEDLVIQAAAGLEQDRPISRVRPAFADLVLAQNRTACLNDAALRPDLSILSLEGQPPFGAVLCSPLRQAERPIGVVAVYTRQPHEWTAVQFRLIEWLTGQCAHILETLRLQNDLRRQAALIDLSPDGILVRRMDGSITLWGSGAQTLYGWSRAEALGQVSHALLKTRFPQPLVEIERQLLQTGRWTGELVHTTRDGDEIIVQSRWLAQRDAHGVISEILESNVDITGSKQAAEALNLRNERLELLSDAAAHLLEAQDPTVMVQELFAKVCAHLNVHAYFNFMVNDAGDALRLDSFAGIPERSAHLLARLEFGQAVCGMVAATRRPMHVPDVQHSEDSLVKLIKSYGIRAYCCHPLMAGERLLGTLSFGSRAKDRFDDDEVAFMRAICHYVAIAKERLRLEKELRQGIAELGAANNQLAEADRRKDEFLAMLAHELRNPLAPVRNAVAVLRLAGPSDARLQRQREVVERQVTHMARLLDDLLDVSRISRGKIQLKKQRLRLGDVVSQAVETVTPLIENRRHTLTVDLPAEDLHLEGDFDRLAQVVGNLLSNAAKYTEEEGRIWLEARSEDGQAVILVRDTGMGIEAEMLPYVFDLFAQAERTVDRSQGGLGIGLTMARKLVQMHGGEIEARSAGLGQGSEFILRLPVLAATRPEAGDADAAEALPHPLAARRILVVDDIADSAETLGELLALWKHEVRTALGGAAALDAAREFRPELVLLDIGMPGMDGFEVARRLRAEHGHDGMTLVAMTGYGQERDRERTRQAGFDAHLVKPVDLAALGQLLARLNARCGPLDPSAAPDAP